MNLWHVISIVRHLLCWLCGVCWVCYLVCYVIPLFGCTLDTLVMYLDTLDVYFSHVSINKRLDREHKHSLWFFLSSSIIPEFNFYHGIRARLLHSFMWDILIHSHYFSSLIALVLCDLQFCQAGFPDLISDDHSLHSDAKYLNLIFCFFLLPILDPVFFFFLFFWWTMALEKILRQNSMDWIMQSGCSIPVFCWRKWLMGINWWIRS